MRHPTRTSDVAVERLIHLDGAEVPYLLRRSNRSRGIRATIDPRRGVLVTVPPATRRGWSQPDALVDGFLRERSRWLLGHLARLERDRADAARRGGATDGGLVLYRGALHRIRVVAAPAGSGRASVERAGSELEDELVVRLADRDRRSLEEVLVGWLRDRASDAVGDALERHATAFGVQPSQVDLRDPRTRWGSASRTGRLMFSWRLVLAPPGSLETVVVHELAHLRVFGHGPRFWALVASRRPDHLADRAWLRRHSHAIHTAFEPMATGG
jgi:predicted metal-dependent hydrolase